MGHGHGAGGAEGVPDLPLGRAARQGAPENTFDDLAFHNVVMPRAGSMELHVVYRIGFDTGILQGRTDRGFHTGSFGLGRGHAEGVGRGARPEKRDRGFLPLHEEQRRALSDHGAVAVAAEGIADAGRQRRKRTEPGDGQAAQAVDTTRDDRIGNSTFQQRTRGDQRLRPGTARGGNREGGAAEAEADGQRLTDAAELLDADVETVR